MEEKNKKPIAEALAEKKDGMDILVRMLAGEEEKKAEEKPTDIFGSFTNIFGMLMIPAIMPFLIETIQKIFTESTMDVRIKSSVAMLPIQIEASTVIIPIEIKASSVTLNVAIQSSAVTLNVNITNAALNVNATIVNSTATLNVNITGAATLNVNVTNSTLYINITGQTVNLKVINPSGIPVYVGIGGKLKRGVATVSIADTTERDVFTLSGRGRIIAIGGYTYGGSYGKDLVILRCYVDGETTASFETTMGTLDVLNGGVLYRKQWSAGTWYSDVLSPIGGLTWADAPSTATPYAQLGFTVALNLEFTSSAVIKVKNQRTDAGANIHMVVFYATYE